MVDRQYLIQVSYDLSNPKTINREKKSLIEAMEELSFNKGYIINSEIDEEEVIGQGESKRKIIYIPLWKWLLTDLC